MEYKNDIYPDNEKPEGKPHCGGCAAECDLYAAVSVPVEIAPKAKVGKIDVACCGDPVVKCECDCRKGLKAVITQKFFIRIPICYEIKTCVGESEIDCGDKK